jgi:hypothetical protein
MEDLASGNLKGMIRQERSAPMAAKDSLVNALIGAGEMVVSTAQTPLIAVGLGSETNEKMEGARTVFDKARKALLSDAQLWRESMDDKARALDPIRFEANVQKNLEKGYSTKGARREAILTDYRSRLKYLKDNPGRILDGFMESLPYMISVGAAGKKAVSMATEKLAKRVFENVTKRSAAKGVVESPGVLAARAASQTTRLLSSPGGQKLIKQVSAATGIGTVGLTEAMTNSAELYSQILGMSPEEASQSEAHEEAKETLAKEAWIKSFAATFAVASLAAAGTGAGAFEASMFTGVGSVQKTARKAIAKQAARDKQGRKELRERLVSPTGEAPKVPVKTQAKKFGKRVAKEIKEQRKIGLTPALKETAEETIQSGGGEQIRQEVSEKATGIEPGPGIGQAYAEGGAIGFFSGGAAGTVTGNLKRLAKAARSGIAGARKSKGYEERIHINVDPEVSANMPGGTSAQETVNEGHKEDRDYKAEYETLKQTMVDTVEDPNIDPWAIMNKLQSIYEAHEAQNKTWTKEEKQWHNNVMSLFDENLVQEMHKLRAKPRTEWDKKDQSLFRSAASRGVLTRADIEHFANESDTDVTDATSDMKALEERAKDVLNETLQKAKNQTERHQVMDSFLGKFSNAINKFGKPGLKWYKQAVLENMANPDEKAGETGYKANIAQLEKFVKSQRTKLKAYQAVLESKESTKRIKYIEQTDDAGGTQMIVEQMTAELEIMEEYEANLKRLWESRGKPTTEAKPAPKPTAAPEAKPEAKEEAPKPTKSEPPKPKKAKAKKAKEKAPEQAELPITVDGHTLKGKELTANRKAARKRNKEAGKKVIRPNYIHQAWTGVGNRIEAIELEDGTWLVRRRESNRAEWSAWKEQTKFNPTGMNNMKRASVRVKDVGTLKTVDPSLIEEEQEQEIGVLQHLIKAGLQIGRSAWESALYLKDQSTETKNVKPLRGNFLGLFHDEGIDLDRLLEWLQEENYLIDASFKEGGPRTLDHGDAIDLIQRALAGELIKPLSDEIPDEQMLDEQINQYWEEQERSEEEYGEPNSVFENVDNKEDENGETVGTHTVPKREYTVEERLAAARALQEVGTVSGTILPHEADRQFFLTQVFQGASFEDAVSALMDHIEPDVVAREAAKKKALAQKVLGKVSIEEATQTIKDVLGQNKKGAVSLAEVILDNIRNFGGVTARFKAWLKGEWVTDDKTAHEALREEELPTSLKEVFKPKQKYTKDITTALPTLLKILLNEGDRKELFNALDLTEVEQQTLYKFALYTNDFKRILRELWRTLPQQKHWAGTQIAEMPTHFFENNTVQGGLTDAVVTAMAFEAMMWVMGPGQATKNNNDETINKILGRPIQEQIDDTEQALFGNIGTLRNNVSMQLGRAIFNHLNLAWEGADGVNNNLQGRLEASLGIWTISVLQQQGRVSLTRMPTSLFQGFLTDRARIAHTDTGADKNFIKNRPVKRENEETGEELWEDANAAMIEQMEEGREFLQTLFGSNYIETGPVFEQPKNAPRTVEGGRTVLSELLRKRVRNNSRRKWKARREGFDRLQARFGSVKDYLANVEGWLTEEEIAAKHVTKRKGLEAKNRALEESMGHMLRFWKKHEDGIFYFTYRVISTMRTYINSNTVNTQQDKIHRFFFGMETWEHRVPTKYAKDDAAAIKRVNQFKIAVAQGLGIDIDKLSREESLRQLDEKLQEKEIVAVINVLSKPEDTPYSPEELAIIKEAIKSGGEATHTYAALEAWVKYITASPSEDYVTLDLPVEIDGLTNGFINLNMQLGVDLNQSFLDILRAGGIFFKGDDWKNFAEYKAEDNDDNYQASARAVSVIFKKMFTSPDLILEYVEKAHDWMTDKQKSEIIAGNSIRRNHMTAVVEAGFMPPPGDLASKVGRKWAKSPLMVVGYGSGHNSIKNKIFYDALAEFYEELAAAGNDIEAIIKQLNKVAVLNAIGSGVEVVLVTEKMVREQAKELAEKKGYEGDDILAFFAREKVIAADKVANMKLAIDATYGSVLEVALTERLKPILELRTQLNHAIKAMNILFVQDVVRRMEILENRKEGPLTSSEIKQLIDEMWKNGLVPSIASRFSEDHTQNVEVTNYALQYMMQKDATGEAKFKALTDIINTSYDQQGEKKGKRDWKSLSARITRRMPDSDVGVSGVVNMIHSFDGSNISRAWGEEFGTLNIHDASFGSFVSLEDVGKVLNQDYVDGHSEWSLSEQVYISLHRMWTALLSNVDTRLTGEQKRAIYEEFANHLAMFKFVPQSALAIDPESSAYNTRKEMGDIAYVEAWFVDFNALVQKNQGIRKRLLENITYSSQYSLDGAEATIIDNVLAALHATLTNPLATVKEVRNAFRDFYVGKREAKLAELKSMLLENMDYLHPSDWHSLVYDFMSRAEKADEEITVDDLLSIYVEVHKERGGEVGEQWRRMYNIIKNYIQDVPMMLEYSTASDGAAFFEHPTPAYPKGRVVLNRRKLSPFYVRDTRNWNDSVALDSVIFHEAIHAANSALISDIAENNPERFTELVDFAAAQWTEWSESIPDDRYMQKVAGHWGTITNPTTKRQAAIMKEGWVKEMLAYMLTDMQIRRKETNVLAENKLWGHDQYMELERILLEVSKEDGKLPKLYNVGRPVDLNLFDDQESSWDKLESDKAVEMWEALEELDDPSTIDRDWQTWLKSLMHNLVVPGLQSIEGIIQQQVQRNPQGSENLGEVEGDKIRLEAAGHRLSNPNSMTMQETAAHEYLHPIIRAALSENPNLGNHAIRKEIRRLFELAKENITPDQIGQERWDYIFNNPNGNIGYQEFMTIGLTNKEMAIALSNINNKDPQPTVRWGAGILHNMLNVLRKIGNWLFNYSVRHEGGNVHEALYSLAKEIVAVNEANLQRKQDSHEGRLSSINAAGANFVSKRILDPLEAAMNKREYDKLDPDKPTVKGVVRSLTHELLKTRHEHVREEYQRFYRVMGGKKDNFIFDMIHELTAWDSVRVNPERGKHPWVDIFRRSKVLIDKARMDMIANTQSFLTEAFDPAFERSELQNAAMTRVLINTDIISLLRGSDMDVGDLVELLNDSNKREDYRRGLIDQLKQELDKQKAGRLFNVFMNQARSMSKIMIDGAPDMKMTQLNTMNVINQRMFADEDKIALTDKQALFTLLDKIITINAFNKISPELRGAALEVVNHEMGRPEPDNGVSRMLGMLIDFNILSEEMLFSEDPIHMVKGYAYEMYDEEANFEVVDDTAANRRAMEEKNMHLAGEVPMDSVMRGKGFRKRLIYKGLKGINRFNKGIVSLTNMQYRGANLFEESDYRSQVAIRSKNDIIRESQRAAKAQFRANHTDSGHNLVPLYDNQGNVVDMRSLMTEEVKQDLLKKNDDFTRVLPRMFGSLTDKTNTPKVNEQVADLVFEEWEGLYDPDDPHPKYRFVYIGANARGEGKEMWRLMPKDMKHAMQKRFGMKGFYLRDEMVNTVLGYRKFSIADNKVWGKRAWGVRMSEKIWQETIQLTRLNIAVTNPIVVIGNFMSNMVMLLSEGIPPKYIRRMLPEAISAMRQYQKDEKLRDHLRLGIGADRARGIDTTAKERRLARVLADLAANPVGDLVKDGLFTSIVEDVGVDDDSFREHYLNKGIKKVQPYVPDLAIDGAKELAMLPGTKSFHAAVMATQYGDFVGRYIKYNYDTKVKKISHDDAINDSLAAFIYYDIPQNKGVQYANDMGFLMFTKFFFRIQRVVGKLYSENPVNAFALFGVQQAFLPSPFDENIANYGLGSGLWQKPTLNPVGRVIDTLNPMDRIPLIHWFLWPFGYGN